MARKSRHIPNDYANYVEHPRYGRVPRFTGLDPDQSSLGWHTDKRQMVPGTAVRADVSRQSHALFPATHYYDVDTVCRDCGRRFIFFALEQKYWYEQLGFPLEVNAVRCIACRKRMHHLAYARKRFEELSHVPARNLEQTLKMADCCLRLIEQSIFHTRQTQRVRMLLNQVPQRKRRAKTFLELTARLHAVEAALGGAE